MGRNIAMEVTKSRFIWKPNIYLQNNEVWTTCANLILSFFFSQNSKWNHEF
jgi:hypothetical protein